MSMSVEAGRSVFRTTTVRPWTVLFATATPPRLDKTNATVVHTALDLPASVFGCARAVMNVG